MKLFGAPARPTLVMKGRFELEQDGHVAWLEYALSGKVLELIHTEVPTQLQGTGIGSSLVKSALEWAREYHVKVDVICPFATEYIGRHPEYSDLLLR
jgi:predicted GNAT family acetyltransferase